MTQIVKTSNATSFPTEAEAERSKAAARVSPLSIGTERPVADSRATKCGTNTLHLPTEIRQALTHGGASTISGRCLSMKFHAGAVEAQHFGVAVRKNSLCRQPSLIGERASRLKCVQVQITQWTLCHGLKKSRWLLQWTISRRHDRFG